MRYQLYVACALKRLYIKVQTQGDVIDASCKLDIVVVGCGLAGLSTAYCLGKAGHRVTILEAASGCSEIGAGIQLAPSIILSIELSRTMF